MTRFVLILSNSKPSGSAFHISLHKRQFSTCSTSFCIYLPAIILTLVLDMTCERASLLCCTLCPPAKVTLHLLQENLFPPFGVAVPTHMRSVRDHLSHLDGISKHILDDWMLLFWSSLCFETNRVWVTNFLGAFSSFPLCQRPGLQRWDHGKLPKGNLTTGKLHPSYTLGRKGG